MSFDVKNLSITLGGKEILKNVNISFGIGRRTAIIGPNGAGKSTLLRALASLNHKYDGEVCLDGKELRSFGRKELSRRLAILPQGMAAPPDVTVAQVVDYGRFPYRGLFSSPNPKEDREVIEWALSRTHLENYVDRKVMSMSGGERQRAFIAMALAQKPEILLLDEPTTYLDIGHQLEVMNIVRDLNRDYQMTVIMVLHDINHALQYADDIVVIKNHGVYAHGTPQEVLTVGLLAEVFGVKADIFVNSQGISVLSPLCLAEE